jgi:hypothetical protein
VNKIHSPASPAFAQEARIVKEASKKRINLDEFRIENL